MRRPLEVVFLLAAILFVGLAIVGIVRGYSPVPFWDMWNGYLGFYGRVSAGEWQAWWEQHNEHRIVLSRILFWIDLACFRGDGRFLLAINGVLLGLIAAVFVRLWREQSAAAAPFVGWFLVAWLWSWMNRDNIAWGFQSQFFLAFLLPLVGLCLLAHGRPGAPGSTARLIGACVAGVLAVGSMASGVLALPVMTVYAGLARQGPNRCMALGWLSAICCSYFFRDYQMVGHHAAGGSLMTKLPQLVGFELVLLGSPAYHLAAGLSETAGLSLAGVAGACLVLASAWTAWRSWSDRDRGALPLALMMFNGYVIAAASATALGRSGFGIAGAVTSRYTLPALMAWAALLVANAGPLTRSGPAVVRGLAAVCALLVVGLLPLQLDAARPRHDELFERQVAALALELGVHDEQQARQVWHSSRAALAIAAEAKEANLSIFGLPPIRDAGDAIGRRFESCPQRAEPLAAGRVLSLEAIADERRFLRIRGEYHPAHAEPPRLPLVMLDAGRQVGAALVKPATAVPDDRPGLPLPGATFSGYVLAAAAGRTLELLDAERCVGVTLELPVVTRWFSVEAEAALPATTVPTTSLLPGTGRWAGTDFDQSRVPRMRVLGSYRTGDADLGVARLRVRRGDRLGYRTGPVAERQTIALVGWPDSSGPLPPAESWRVIVFDEATLPEEFEIELADQGADWGEWSAILLLEPESAAEPVP
jgi:hypothetical protein